MFPNEFNKVSYIDWHKNHFSEDDLENKIDAQRESLKTTSVEDLEFLGELLYYVLPLCKKEYNTSKEVDFEYQIPLKDALKERQSQRYDWLFKSTESIINKLWRKNKTNPTVNLASIPVEITDLVRTEIVCSSLAACHFVSKRLILKNINLPSDYELKERLDKKIESIEFEPEMKMAAGYFAYHGAIKFKSGLQVELQVYSSLTNNWRKLSHKLYERVRLTPSKSIDFGTSEARLISLGHLLHLAECEVQRLEEEIK